MWMNSGMWCVENVPQSQLTHSMFRPNCVWLCWIKIETMLYHPLPRPRPMTAQPPLLGSFLGCPHGAGQIGHGHQGRCMAGLDTCGGIRRNPLAPGQWAQHIELLYGSPSEARAWSEQWDIYQSVRLPPRSSADFDDVPCMWPRGLGSPLNSTSWDR